MSIEIDFRQQQIMSPFLLKNINILVNDKEKHHCLCSFLYDMNILKFWDATVHRGDFLVEVNEKIFMQIDANQNLLLINWKNVSNINQNMWLIFSKCSYFLSLRRLSPVCIFLGENACEKCKKIVINQFQVKNSKMQLISDFLMNLSKKKSS